MIPLTAAATTSEVSFLNTKAETQGFDISKKSVCLIGCGGLGCNVAVHLAGAGVGKLYLCDFDTVNESNLNRQFLYTKDSVGKPKCRVAEERLASFSADTEYIAAEKKISNEEDLDFARECDIVILAVDNAKTRVVLQQFCTKNRIPLVCGGIDGFYGMCYLYIPDVSPCPDCAGMNEGTRAKHNVSATAGIIGSAESALAIEYLVTENKNLSGKILMFDESDFQTLKISPRSDCPLCKKRG